MTLDLTATNATPILFKRSIINDDSRIFGTFTASTMQALLERVVDGDPFSYWHSAVGDDAITEILNFSVQQRSALTPTVFNALALQNINWKRFKVEYKSGAGAFAIVPGFDFTGSDNADADIIKDIGSITADTFKATITTTFDVDDKKRLGGIYAVPTRVQLAGGFLNAPRADDEATRRHEMGDKSLFIDNIFHSATSYQFYRAPISLDLITDAELDIIDTIKREGDAFVWMPFPGTHPRQIFTGHFLGAVRRRFVSSNTLAGWRVDFTFRERGVL